MSEDHQARDTDDAEDERETIDVALVVGDAICEITSARIESHENQKMVVTLTEEGLANYIRELELWRHLEDSKEWLEEVADE